MLLVVYTLEITKCGTCVASQVFGDNIDTDAILPGEYLHLNDMEELGHVCFEHTNPDFRSKVAEGFNIGMSSRPCFAEFRLCLVSIRQTMRVRFIPGCRDRSIWFNVDGGKQRANDLS